MKSFEELTSRGQVRRLRQLAKSALEDYGFQKVRLKSLNHWENTTFCVDVSSEPHTDAVEDIYMPCRYLLRIHRNGYHSPESVVSEMRWLTILRHQARLPVPEPVTTWEGKFITTASAPGVPSPRICSLVRWMTGRFYHRTHLSHAQSLGKLMGSLHNYAEHWEPPCDFTRPIWNWDGFYGETASYMNFGQSWKLTPQPYRDLFKIVADRMYDAMHKLGEDKDAFGMIHADLQLGNVLFSAGKARAIDFDDCGLGYWIYDIAVALWNWRRNESWSLFRDALIDGYQQVRSLPEKQIAYLDLFMASRRVEIALWAVGRTQDHPTFRDQIEGRLRQTSVDIKQLLDL